MPGHESQLKRIQEKIQHVLKERLLLQKENDRLEKELAKNKEQSTHQLQLIYTLQQQVEILKLNSGEMNENDKKEIEKRINSYIKEIDRCITMLKV